MASVFRCGQHETCSMENYNGR